jgi:hypothetical protein
MKTKRKPTQITTENTMTDETTGTKKRTRVPRELYIVYNINEGVAESILVTRKVGDAIAKFQEDVNFNKLMTVME